MNIRCLWRIRQSLLRWSLLLLVMAAVGAALHILLPPEPRWTIAGEPRSIVFLDDTLLATCTLHGGMERGPVQLWDRESGREVDRFLTHEPTLKVTGSSKDKRLFFAVARGKKPDVHRICSVDPAARRQREVEALLGDFDSGLFAPSCAALAVRLRTVGVPEASYALAETSTGRIIDRFKILMAAPKNANLLGYWNPSHRSGSFTDDGDFFVICYREVETERIRVVSTRTGKTTLLDNANVIAVAPDSRSLIADRGDAGPWIWDLEAMHWRCPIDWKVNRPVAFSPDYRLMACVEPEGNEEFRVKLIELQTGQVHWQFSFTPDQGMRFSPDSRYFLLSEQPTEGLRRLLVVFDIERKEQLWERAWEDDLASVPEFTPDSRTVIAALATRCQVEIIDAESGQSRFSIPPRGSRKLSLRLTDDGNSLLVDVPRMWQPSSFWSEFQEWLMPVRNYARIASPANLHVLDIETGQELYRMQTDSEIESAIAQDRRNLVIVRHYNDPQSYERMDTIIDCWDIPGRKPLRWVIGVPVTLGALLMLRAGWRLRRRPAVTGPFATTDGTPS